MVVAAKSQIRIIAGSLRGSRIPVLSLPGLRPTPDRIRETLFNWLSGHCRGATVLDCFSGSGALGFEAVSRGAEGVAMIERDRNVVKNLKQQADRLKLDNVEIIHADALTAINGLRQNFSLVFIDPPYAEPSLRQRTLSFLVEQNKLTDGAQIYLEWPDSEVFELDDPHLSWLKHKKAGQVNYAIAEWRLSR